MFNVVYTITHWSEPNFIEVKSESFHYFNLYWINLEIPMCADTLLFVILFSFFIVLFVILCILLNSNSSL